MRRGDTISPPDRSARRPPGVRRPVSRGALAVKAENWAEPAPQRKPARPRLHVVPDAKTAHRRRVSGMCTGLALVAICFGLFGIVGLHVMLAQGQDAVQDLQEQLAAEQERQQDLSLDVARLQAPAQVVAAAKAQGMVTATTVVALRAASLDSPPQTTIPAPNPTTTALERAPSTTRP